MTIGERIRQRRKDLGISAEYLAEKLGVSPATIYRYEKGDIEKMPIDILKPLSALLHTEPAALMGWVEAQDEAIPDNILPLPKMIGVPLLGPIACGDPILAAQNIEAIMPMPEGVRADFCLRCRGDSMIGARIRDGDLVYIRQQPTVDDGQIAAVLIGEEATLKRVYHNGGALILQAENPAYKPIVISGAGEADVRVLGLAVAFTSEV